MLTEAEKKWLEERENRICKFCIHCPGYLNTIPCLDWWDGTCMMDTTLEEFRDAAEFEARVAAKLAQSPCWSCPEKSKLSCPRGKSEANGRPKAEACRLKHARLAVEEEMGNGRTV